MHGALRSACIILPAHGPSSHICSNIQCLLTVLGLLGVVIDPTTAGVEDSNMAMGYEKPWNNDVDWDGTPEVNNG